MTMIGFMLGLAAGAFLMLTCIIFVEFTDKD